MTGVIEIERIVVLNDASVAAGGATGLALASAEAFGRLGIPTVFLAGDAGQNPSLAAAGVEAAGLGQARLLSSPMSKVILGAVYNQAAERMISDWIAKFDTPGTIYHLHGWAQIFSPSVFRPLTKVADRLVLSAHDFFLVCPNGSYSFLRSGEVCTLTPQSLRCVAAHCDRRSYAHKLWRVARQAVRRMTFDLSRERPTVLAIHERMRPFLERGGVPADVIRALPNPVRAFLDVRVKAECNDEFLFIGRLEHGKGPDLACAAATAAGVKLRVIGDGPMGDALKRDYPNVTFSGRLPSDEIEPLARGARALIMPSRYPEPYGLVAAEALWSGLPVIAARTAFLAPDIVARCAGIACEPRDTQGLAQAMRSLADDDETTLAMSMAAFNDTRDIGLTFDCWVAALLDTYRERLAFSAARRAPLQSEPAS